MNLIATMAALTVIDKIGRRQLMIVGSIGYLVSLGFLAGMIFAYEGGWFEEGSAAPVWLILLGLLGFIASHAFGQGSVIWVFYLGNLPQPRTCARPVAGFAHALGVRLHYHLCLPCAHR